MQNQKIKQSWLETNIYGTNVTRIHLIKNGHIVNGLLVTSKRINDTVYQINLAMDSLCYVRNFNFDPGRNWPQTKLSMEWIN